MMPPMSTQSTPHDLDVAPDVDEGVATSVAPEGFDPAALHLLKLSYGNLFDPVGGRTHGTKWRCKGCHEVVSTMKRASHHDAHKRQSQSKGGTKYMATAKGKLTAIQAIVKVLTDAGKPMKMPEIIKEAVPLTALKGKYPGQTLYSVAYSHVKKADALIEKTANKGEFKLARPSRASKATVEEVTPKRNTAAKSNTVKKTTAKRSSTAKRKTTAKKKATAKRATATPHPKPGANQRKRRAARRSGAKA